MDYFASYLSMHAGNILFFASFLLGKKMFQIALDFDPSGTVKLLWGSAASTSGWWWWWWWWMLWHHRRLDDLDLSEVVGRIRAGISGDIRWWGLGRTAVGILDLEVPVDLLDIFGRGWRTEIARIGEIFDDILHCHFVSSLVEDWGCHVVNKPKPVSSDFWIFFVESGSPPQVELKTESESEAELQNLGQKNFFILFNIEF